MESDIEVPVEDDCLFIVGVVPLLAPDGVVMIEPDSHVLRRTLDTGRP